MNDKAINGSATPTPAHAGSQSTASQATVPAKSPEPVKGPLDGSSAVTADPVAKDDSKTPNSPQGPLVPASALQRDTEAALEEMRKAEDAYKQALTKLSDPAAVAKRVGDASQKLLDAVGKEEAVLVPPNAGTDDLVQARATLLTLHAFDDAGKRIVREAFQVIIRQQEAPSAVKGLEVLDRQSATRPDPLAAAIKEFPSLGKLDADFGRAYKRLDGVTVLMYGRPVVTGYIQQLQQAADDRYAGWLEACRTANQGDNLELKDACQLGLDEAGRGKGLVNEPASIEMLENPLYARGVAASGEFDRAVKSGEDHVALGAAARAAWEAAEKDATTRNNPDYVAACRANLQALSEFQKSHADPEHMMPRYDIPPPP